MRAWFFAAALAVLGSSSGCGRPDVPGTAGPSALVGCRLPGGARAVCGRLAVPESHEAGGAPSPRIELRFAVVRSEADQPQVPVVLLAGGPGQSAIEAFGPALETYGAFLRDRDVLLLDQRGTGASGALHCERADEALRLSDSLSIDVEVERVAACRDTHAGVDLGAYATPQAVQDLALVLDEVGFRTVNLVGVSYGTRMATAFARRYPERVRAMVLDAVAPVDMTMPLSFGVDAERSLHAMFEDCAADASCAASFGDVRASLTEALKQIPEGGRTVTVIHPRTGEPTPMEIDEEVVLQGLRAILYVPEIASVLPLSISRAAADDWGPLVSQFMLLSDGLSKGVAGGMFLSVLCTEDVPFIREADLLEPANVSRFGTSIVEALKRSCEQWVQGPLPLDYRDPVAVDTPTLLLSGALDPVTPPRWAAHAAASLSNARSVVLPGAGHGTLSQPCMAGVVDAFLDNADPAAVDASCAEERGRMPFFVDFAGPALGALVPPVEAP